MRYIYYQPLTGKIVKFAWVDAAAGAIINDLDEGWPYVEFPENYGAPDNYWVTNIGGIVLKTEMVINIPSFIEGIQRSITGIPSGTNVDWPDGVTTMENDGTIEVSFEAPGNYYFNFRNPKYFDKQVTINVSA
jgi:hypothetical protein